MIRCNCGVSDEVDSIPSRHRHVGAMMFYRLEAANRSSELFAVDCR
ncbi:hypothetical protein IWY39_002257 [Sphingobium sp. JAI105]|nr:hypothetical protein [Sphingobium sp. JAI105]